MRTSGGVYLQLSGAALGTKMSGMFHSKAVCFSLILLLFTLCPRFARADDDMDARTDLAGQVLELAYSPENLRDSFAGFLGPALDAMERDGMPKAARPEVEKAFTEWFNEEVKWPDIKPKLVQIYARAFTRDELRMLLAFLQQPLGQRVMAKLPLVMQDGSLAGQQYFMSKPLQDSLHAKLDPIIEKYMNGGAGKKSSNEQSGKPELEN